MKLYDFNKNEIDSKKHFIYKINGKEYLFYTIKESDDGLTNIGFGRLIENKLVNVDDKDMDDVSKFLSDLANNRLDNKYILESDKNINVTVEGGSKTDLPSSAISSISSPINILKNKAKSTKKKNNNMIIALISLVLLLILFFIGYKLITSPKFMAISSINAINKEFNETFNGKTMKKLSRFLYSNDKTKITQKLTINADPKLGLSVDTYMINTTYMENISSKTSYLSANIMRDQKASATGGNVNGANIPGFSADAILSNNKLYFTIKDTLSKYYYSDQKYFSIFNKIDTNNIDVFRKLLMQSFENNIKNEDFKVTSDEIQLVSNTNVKKYSLVLSVDKMTTIMTDYFNRIKKDGDAMNILMNTNGLTKDEVSIKLDKITKNFQTKYNYASTFNMYVEGFNKVVLLEVVNEQNTFRFYRYDNIQKFVVTDSKTQKENFSLKLTADKDASDLVLVYDGKTYLTGSISKNGTFDLTYDNQNNGKIEFKGNFALNEVSDEDYNALFNTAIIINDNKDGKNTAYTVNVKDDIEFSKGDTIDTSVIKDADSIKNISASDSEALEKIEGIFLQTIYSI